MREDLIKVQN